METLDAGTYLLQPSWEDTAPRARLDLPAGWNAWQGPNRFDGDLDTTTWYAGLLVVEVDAVASKPCVDPQSDDVVGDSRAELVAALRRLPGARVSVDEVPDEMFGYPATHLRMTFPVPPRKCQVDVNVLTTNKHGIVAGGRTTRSGTSGSSTSTATRSWWPPATARRRRPRSSRSSTRWSTRSRSSTRSESTSVRRGSPRPWRQGRGGTASAGTGRRTSRPARRPASRTPRGRSRRSQRPRSRS